MEGSKNTRKEKSMGSGSRWRVTVFWSLAVGLLAGCGDQVRTPTVQEMAAF
jgi:hypothetical protein